MKQSKNKKTKFLDQYKKLCDDNPDIHQELEKMLRKILASAKIDVHQVKCRLKTAESVREKLKTKRYKNPKLELTDILGARIITYYAVDTKKVVQTLKDNLIIDIRNSSDKRKALTLKEFGYKSIHLQAAAKPRWLTSFNFPKLNKWKFEIQVRSILEHVWAEIEHEIVYKGGINYPEDIKRNFARLAGTLELLEDSFLDLRNQKFRLIEQYKEKFTSGKDLETKLDVAKTLGLFEAEEPDLLSWRQADLDNTPFQPGSDLLVFKALYSAKIRTPRQLRSIIRRKAFNAAVVSLRRAGKEVTHFTLALLVLALTNEKTLISYFPTQDILEIIKSSRIKRRQSSLIL